MNLGTFLFIAFVFAWSYYAPRMFDPELTLAKKKPKPKDRSHLRYVRRD